VAVVHDRGIVNQDGDSLFNQSFAISTHTPFNEATEMKLALEHHVETDISVNPYSDSYLKTSIPAQGMNT
jgi:hypothetical protein